MYSLLFVFFAVSIIFSFLCSLWEAVLLSITPSYMQVKLNEGGAIGPRLQQFKQNIDKPLAAILSLNTIAHTVGAIGVGQEATKIWAESNPLITGVAVPVLMTAAILIISEIIPKTMGATNWRALAPFTVHSLAVLLVVLAPLVWMCQVFTALFYSGKGRSAFTRSDFLAMAQLGSQEGELNPVETQFIHNIINLKHYQTRQIMTPRTVVVVASEEMPFREFYDKQDELIFSRIPLYRADDKEHISGYILKDEVLEHLVEGEEGKPLKTLKRDIVCVMETYNIFQLFNDFVQKREHIALVVDEFGSMTGVVSMEDVIETLLGLEIVDETDKNVNMQALARRDWKKRFKNSEDIRASQSKPTDS
ncbi:MAG: CNNM domain-containing protein [Candidatus Hinthialibacter antarcticus]|nr:CNNM domain-containing protein [Candidatus Hinthialibacter antarcticus]